MVLRGRERQFRKLNRDALSNPPQKNGLNHTDSDSDSAKLA